MIDDAVYYQLVGSVIIAGAMCIVGIFHAIAMLRIARAIHNISVTKHTQYDTNPSYTPKSAQIKVPTKAEFEITIPKPPRPAGGFGLNCNIDRGEAPLDDKGETPT